MKVLSFVTCEDVRQEVGGKFTLCGVFDGLVISRPHQSAELAVRVAAHLRLALEPGDPLPAEHRLRASVDGEVIANATGTFTIQDRDKPITLAVPMGIYPIKASTSVLFEFGFFDAKGSSIAEYGFQVPITVLESASAPPAAPAP
jgi:hypothetical protein